MPPRHRRQSAGQSPDRRVEFKETLISGPSGSYLQPNLDSASEASESDLISEIESMDLDEQQLQSDLIETVHHLNEDPDKDDTPEIASEFWDSLKPGVSSVRSATPFRKLTCAKKDYRVCKALNFLVDEIVQFARDTAGTVDEYFMDDLINNEDNKVLIRYIGCIAQGGPQGEAGWEELLTDETCREALVIGIIARALEEHVFSELLFGGDTALTERLKSLEQEQIDDEGFSRTESRAAAITAAKPDVKLPSFEKAVTDIASKLLKVLGTFCPEVDLATGLGLIVAHAAKLSRMLRTASDVVYYWPPTFKDEEFEPGRMEAYNLADMIAGSPYDRKIVNGHERAILKPGMEGQSEAIVRVVCFPGLVAYRQFGGELAKKEIEAEKRGMPVPDDVQAHRRRAGEKPLSTDQGIRSRVIRKSLVLLQWGKQRLLTKEAGTSTHIDAVRDGKMGKYEKDYENFVELYSLAESLWPEH